MSKRVPMGWKIDERELRDDVKLALPKDWELAVFHVTSGDSGKQYWVQWLHKAGLKAAVGKWEGDTDILVCDCPEGKFKAPLTILGLHDFICKHATTVVECSGRTWKSGR